MMRQLIVNADDFGRSAGINRGVIETHEHGIVTSASLMVRWPAAAEAARYARERSALGLGLHVDLSEWSYRDNRWHAVYQLVAGEDGDAVRAEVERQLARFRELVDADPDHLDSHHHVHREEPVHSVLATLADELGVPLRGRGAVRYCGEFYGRAKRHEPLPDHVSVDGLISILRSLPAGVTELGCHPGYADDLETSYRDERAAEVRTLCDPRVRAVLAEEQIELRSFAELGPLALA